VNVPTPELPAQLLRDCHRPAFLQHAVRFLLFLAIYGAAATLAVHWVSGDLTWWKTCLLPALYILCAASLHGISLFTHEAVHGTLAPRRWLNGLLGALCALPVLQNYSAYRVLHLRHHQHLGEEGDPDHYANYTRWTWMIFIMNWLRLLFGYPVYITAIPILGFRQGDSPARWGIVSESIAAVLMIWAALEWIPINCLLHAWLVPMLLINTMVNIRGMSQHTLLGHSNDPVLGTRSILTSAPVRFFMCNENYHLEHHLYPGVPWHHLPQVHSALAPALRNVGAPYIRSYTAFVLEFIRHSIRRSPIGRDPDADLSRRPPQP